MRAKLMEPFHDGASRASRPAAFFSQRAGAAARVAFAMAERYTAPAKGDGDLEERVAQLEAKKKS